jgi:hypothetical protein
MWCSSSCRHRAWELSPAAESGRAAVEVVDRMVEVDGPVPLVEQALVSPQGRACSQALADLVAELDTRRVYDRDLPPLADALGRALTALDRRPGGHDTTAGNVSTCLPGPGYRCSWSCVRRGPRLVRN